MKKIINCISILFLLTFVSCTANEPQNAEGIERNFEEHSWTKAKHTNKEKVNVELLHKDYDMKVYKITINDTLVNYVGYEHNTGYIKLN